MFIAYTNALDLARSLKPIVEALRAYDADLAKQLQRAATSVALNVAEGSERRGRDPKRFFTMAHGSASEVRACLDLIEVWEWSIDTRIARQLLDREMALLWGLTNPIAKAATRHPVARTLPRGD
jgi:four helix bundle protein